MSLVDPDRIDLTNTNRLIGGTLVDVREAGPRPPSRRGSIRGLHPNRPHQSLQMHESRGTMPSKRSSDATSIVGAVDGSREREQLERFARRHLIPYIDVGMDVHETGQGHFVSAAR